MKKLIYLILTILILSTFVYAKSAFIAATDLTGGAAGALDAIECEDILGNNTNRAIATGDTCIVMNSSKAWYVYRYNASGADAESSPDIIVPDDRVADCAGNGQWELVTSTSVAASNNPTITFNETDGTDWQLRVDDTGNSFEIGSSAGGIGDNVELEIDEDGDIHVTGNIYSGAYLIDRPLKSETFSIVEPDTIQGITDDVVLKHVMADAYPSGITIKDIAISSSSAYTSEVFLIEEWDDRAGSSQSTIESITISSQYQEDDGTLSDASIAADAFIVVNLDDTPEDIGMVEITITYYVN